jgi:uncharacterized membrane protein YdjX (TVP38/TMEM64 family)
VAVLAAAARLLPLRDALAHFQASIGNLGARGVVLFAAVYLLAALLLGPVWLLTIAAGVTYPLLSAVALVSVVSTGAAGAAFSIARHFARSRVERLTAKQPKFQAIDRAVAREGWKIVFLLRLSPVVPYGLSNYVYGVTAIGFWPFLLASWIGMLPATVLYVSLGAAGRVAIGAAGARQRTPLEWTALAVGILATAAVTVWVARIAKKELARSRLEDVGGRP